MCHSLQALPYSCSPLLLLCSCCCCSACAPTLAPMPSSPPVHPAQSPGPPLLPAPCHFGGHKSYCVLDSVTDARAATCTPAPMLTTCACVHVLWGACTAACMPYVQHACHFFNVHATSATCMLQLEHASHVQLRACHVRKNREAMVARPQGPQRLTRSTTRQMVDTLLRRGSKGCSWAFYNTCCCVCHAAQFPRTCP